MIPFPTNIQAIEERIHKIDPVKYAFSRNFNDGAVTRLSPYVSRGVISTRKVFDHIRSLELEWAQVEKLVQELAWRDYWQLVWKVRGDGIHQDIKQQQISVDHWQTPGAIIHANTGIDAVDEAIKGFYETGYMHNHMRMYVASISCNIARAHWHQPATWMYYHLLDGDLASNHLSWQWVAGTFSGKKYYANQANINKYFHSEQKGTFLDVEYEDFEIINPPERLQETVDFRGKYSLPVIENPDLNKSKTTLIYNYYNLDPNWHSEEDVQRILLLEPSLFRKYPVSRKCIDFALALSENIPGIKLFVGEFSDLPVGTRHLIYKEHPLNRHYKGKEESREWICSTEGFFPSFFAFWKKCKKEKRYDRIEDKRMK